MGTKKGRKDGKRKKEGNCIHTPYYSTQRCVESYVPPPPLAFYSSSTLYHRPPSSSLSSSSISYCFSCHLIETFPWCDRRGSDVMAPRSLCSSGVVLHFISRRLVHHRSEHLYFNLFAFHGRICIPVPIHLFILNCNFSFICFRRLPSHVICVHTTTPLPNTTTTTSPLPLLVSSILLSFFFFKLTPYSFLFTTYTQFQSLPLLTFSFHYPLSLLDPSIPPGLLPSFRYIIKVNL